ncbi:zinc knuckle CX2CX4HX4C containing protein, partial [Tanacetum coccineum]
GLLGSSRGEGNHKKLNGGKAGKSQPAKLNDNFALPKMTNMDLPQSTIVVDEPSMNDATENVVVSLGTHHVSFHLHHNHDSVVSQAEQVVSDNGKAVHTSIDDNKKPASYATMLNVEQTRKNVNFRVLNPTESVVDADLVILLVSIEENTWAKFGLIKVMMNSNGFFLFKFSSRSGLEQVLEHGPWLIRIIPIILKTWTHNSILTKENIMRVPAWVKLYDVPIITFTEVG